MEETRIKELKDYIYTFAEMAEWAVKNFIKNFDENTFNKEATE